MADRILTWHEKGEMSETGVVGTNVSTEFTLDKNYDIPEKVILRLKTAGEDDAGNVLKVDINYKPPGKTASSIFRNEPALSTGATEYEGDDFSTSLEFLEEGTVMTLDIDSVCKDVSGADLTVELYLNQL